MQFEPIVLFSLFGYPVYAYGLCLAVSVLFCTAILTRRAKISGLKNGTTSAFILYSLVLGVFCARLFYFALRYEDMLYDGDGAFKGLGVFLRVWEGGFTIYGAMAGVFLAVLLCAWRTKQPAGIILDWAAPAAAVMVTLARSVEILGSGGFGSEIISEFHGFFPLAVYNDWLGSWNYAIFMAEALAACLTALLLFWFDKKPHHCGDTALVFFVFYGASQIVLERFRSDDILTWGFVLVAQVISALFIFLADTAAVIRSIRAGMKKGPAYTELALTVFVIAWSGLVEYLLEKTLFGKVMFDNTFLHVSRVAALAGIAGLICARLLRTAKACREIPA